LLHRKLKVSDTTQRGSGRLGISPCRKTGFRTQRKR